jgi:beta-glucosidase
MERIKIVRMIILRVAVLLGLASTLCVMAAFQIKGGQTPRDSEVKELLARMTLEEKVGQMTQPEQSALKDPADIENYFVGSLLSGGDSDPKEGNSFEAWRNLYDSLQAHTQKTRLQIPILYGIDAVHGHNNVLGAVIFPHHIGLGCTRNPALIEKVERATAEEVRATGIQWAFGPCVTVPQDARWGRTYEGFSEDPAVVKQLAGPAVRGFQGMSLAAPLSVLACAKHFAGDGGTAFGSARGGGALLDQGDTRVDEATLRRIHLPGYVAAIQAGVGSIMPSYNSWNGVKASASHRLLTEILKEELGFKGFLISDYNAIDQIAKNYKEAIGISINAGMDMVMVPQRYREFYTDLMELVKEGEVPMSRIDDAVTRILRVKFEMGLMDKNRSQMSDPKLAKLFGSTEHRAIARQAVRESLVVLKNERVLPLSKSLTRIHVGGKSADDIGNQCGGWTISWQGASGDVTTGGTTILAAIKKAVSAKTEVTFSKDGSGAAGAKIGIVVIGEKPYAEMKGDRADLALEKEDQDAVSNMKAAGIPVVVIVISGRPLILGDVADKADALIAAWLPGTEGQGIADILFGDFKPTGKLSFSWPRAMSQMPSHVGDANYDPLFKLGYGLLVPKR